MESIDPRALGRAVESGDLAKVKQVGDAMHNKGWAVNWMHHAETANAAGHLAMRNYLLQKAGVNTYSKTLLRRGGGKKRKTVRHASRQRSRR